MGLYMGSFRLMERFGVSRGVAVATSTAFLISPSFVLYEHWLFYTFPLATVVVLSLIVLARFLDHPTQRLATLFSSMLLFLCASWSVYQLLYFFLVVGSVAGRFRAGRRALLLGSALPLAILCAIYLKNTVIFGIPTTSSWTGMSLAKMTIWYAPPRALADLVASGTLSPLALTEPFSQPDEYPNDYFAFDTGRWPTVPVLTQRLKSTGLANYNNIGYLRVSATYLRDALTVLRRYPSTFIAACADAWRIYFWSTAGYDLLDVNKAHIARWSRAFDRGVYGRWGDSGLYLGLWIALPLAVAFALVRLIRGPNLRLDQSVLLLSVVINILFLAVVGNSVEVGENNRFRFTTDALSMTLLAAGCVWTAHSARARRTS
jgi:hypothetical protein